MQLRLQKVLPCEFEFSCLWTEPSLEDKVSGDHFYNILSCSPKIISLLPNRANKKFHLITHYTNSDPLDPKLSVNLESILDSSKKDCLSPKRLQNPLNSKSVWFFINELLVSRKWVG